MSTTAMTTDAASAPPPVRGLEDFFAAMRSSNPFVDNRVNGQSSDGVDVDDIHRAAFDSLTSLARQSCDLRRGLGAMLWGEAGIGKSHLLARLLRWAEQDQQAIAVYLHNLQASPENLPRSLLKAVVSILTRGQAQLFGRTPLFNVVLAFVMESLKFDTTRNHPWPLVYRAYGKLIDSLSAADPSRAALIDRTVFDVLYRFFRSVYRYRKTREERVAALAVRWLSGDFLDPEEAHALNLPRGGAADEPVALTDNQQIKQVLVALSRMALSRKQPFILCFDQVDNLDDDQAAALARFLEALIDSAPNLLVVTAGIQSTFLRWKETGVIQSSAWDRIAQFEISLQKLRHDEVRRLVSVRLERVVAPFAEVEAVRQEQQRDNLFPLGRVWAERFFARRVDWRPRDAINGACDAWQIMQKNLLSRGGIPSLDDWHVLPSANGELPPAEFTEEQSRDAIDRMVTKKVADCCEETRRTSGSLPPDADNLAGLIDVLLQQVGGVEIERPTANKAERGFPYNLIVRQLTDGSEVRTGVRCLATDSAISTTSSLRWIIQDDKPPDRVLLVTDERRPLAFGAKPNAQGRLFFDELRQRGHGKLQHVELTFDDYALLDAVVSTARSNDLEIELPAGKTRSVSAAEIIAAHRRAGRYASLPVLRDLFAAPVRSLTPGSA